VKVSELALLKIMHQRISPNTTGMEYYSRAFSALLLIEQATVHDLCRLTELDYQSVSHLVKNLEKEEIIRSLNGQIGEFVINLEPERLFGLIEKKQKKEFSWITARNKAKEKAKNSQALVCTIAAR
jgi:sugar-specific transcriptional regulator TrmB